MILRGVPQTSEEGSTIFLHQTFDSDIDCKMRKWILRNYQFENSGKNLDSAAGFISNPYGALTIREVTFLNGRANSPHPLAVQERTVNNRYTSRYIGCPGSVPADLNGVI